MKSKTLKNIGNSFFAMAGLAGLCTFGGCSVSMYYDKKSDYTNNTIEMQIENKYNSLENELKESRFQYYLPEESRNLYLKGLKMELEALSKAKEHYSPLIDSQKKSAIILDAKRKKANKSILISTLLTSIFLCLGVGFDTASDFKRIKEEENYS